jgi:hypothetical protein
MSRTEKLRRLAARLRIEKQRLLDISDEMVALKYPMTAGDVRRYGLGCYIISLSMDHFAEIVRDKRGAKRLSQRT